MLNQPKNPCNTGAIQGINLSFYIEVHLLPTASPVFYFQKNHIKYNIKFYFFIKKNYFTLSLMLQKRKINKTEKSLKKNTKLTKTIDLPQYFPLDGLFCLFVCFIHIFHLLSI